MTQEGRVEEFWTTKRRDRLDTDNVRPLLKALAAARRSLDEDHQIERHGEPVDRQASVVDLRTEARRIHSNDVPIQFVPEVEDPDAAEGAGAAADAPVRAVSARTADTDWIMIEPERSEPPPPRQSPPAQHPAPQWGDLWRNSVQGWVRQADGAKVWRPIVTTTTSVPNWDIDTNLGMVTGESACAVDAIELGGIVDSDAGKVALTKALERDRASAQDTMVAEAVARGAHAVIGVNLDYTFLGECIIVTATGTAVTLRTPI